MKNGENAEGIFFCSVLWWSKSLVLHGRISGDHFASATCCLWAFPQIPSLSWLAVASSVQWGSEWKWLLVGKEGWDYRESFHLGALCVGREPLALISQAEVLRERVGCWEGSHDLWFFCSALPPQLLTSTLLWARAVPVLSFLLSKHTISSLAPSWYEIIAFCSWLSSTGGQSSICDMELRGRPQGSVLNVPFSVAVSIALYSLQEYFQKMFFGMSQAFQVFPEKMPHRQKCWRNSTLNKVQWTTKLRK